VVPKYFLFSALRSVIVFQKPWIMVSASALGIEKEYSILMELEALKLVFIDIYVPCLFCF
jgi:hypothetical protein